MDGWRRADGKDVKGQDTQAQLEPLQQLTFGLSTGQRSAGPVTRSSSSRYHQRGHFELKQDVLIKRDCCFAVDGLRPFKEEDCKAQMERD